MIILKSLSEYSFLTISLSCSDIKLFRLFYKRTSLSGIVDASLYRHRIN
nr:MAG TPA: hypothetical protein [Caudoviricetes sp.]